MEKLQRLLLADASCADPRFFRHYARLVSSSRCSVVRPARRLSGPVPRVERRPIPSVVARRTRAITAFEPARSSPCGRSLWTILSRVYCLLQGWCRRSDPLACRCDRRDRWPIASWASHRRRSQAGYLGRRSAARGGRTSVAGPKQSNYHK